jgi:hypothetical protein
MRAHERRQCLLSVTKTRFGPALLDFEEIARDERPLFSEVRVLPDDELGQPSGHVLRLCRRIARERNAEGVASGCPELDVLPQFLHGIDGTAGPANVGVQIEFVDYRVERAPRHQNFLEAHRDTPGRVGPLCFVRGPDAFGVEDHGLRSVRGPSNGQERRASDSTDDDQYYWESPETHRAPAECGKPRDLLASVVRRSVDSVLVHARPLFVSKAPTAIATRGNPNINDIPPSII